MPSTSQGLAETAQKYARRAVSYFIDNDHSDFYLAAGVALEHAMKARLAREDVLFIAPANDFRSAVALWRTADNFQSLPFGTRTVSGADAVARVTIVDKNFAPHGEAAKQILRCRNGEAHVGAPGSTEHDKDFANFLASIESLSEGSSDEFWGQHVDLVRVTLDQNAAQVAKEVTQKIGVARGNYSRRFGSLDDEQRRGLFAFIEQQVDAGLSDDVLRTECPACSGPALLYGENSVEFDIDVDHRSGAITVLASMLNSGRRFCGVGRALCTLSPRKSSTPQRSIGCSPTMKLTSMITCVATTTPSSWTSRTSKPAGT